MAKNDNTKVEESKGFSIKEGLVLLNKSGRVSEKPLISTPLGVFSLKAGAEIPYTIKRTTSAGKEIIQELKAVNPTPEEIEKLLNVSIGYKKYFNTPEGWKHPSLK